MLSTGEDFHVCVKLLMRVPVYFLTTCCHGGWEQLEILMIVREPKPQLQIELFLFNQVSLLNLAEML